MTYHPPIGKTLGELAKLVDGRLEGDASFVVTGAAGLSEATAKDISFLGNPKYAAAALMSQAGCLFLTPAAAKTPGGPKNRIYVEDPTYAFSLVLGLIEEGLPKVLPVLDTKSVIHYQAKLGQNVSVGPFTVIERGALVGEGTVIGPQVYIGDGAKIGRFCKIYPQVVIRENCVIGDRSIIHSGAVIGSDGFGFATDRKTGKHRKIPQIGNVVLQDDVEIGANVAIDRATTGSTVVGAGTKIDNLVQLGHNVRTGSDCLLVSQCGVAGSTTLGHRVVLAGQAGLAGHIKVGDGAIITAQTGIMGDVEKGQILFGSPGRPHREAFRLQAIYGKLPEIYDAIKEIKTRLGIGGKTEA